MNLPPYLTPPQVARQLRVGREKVLSWIHAGELEAANGATCRSGRPRYLITPGAVESFLAARRVLPAPKPTPRRRCKAAPAVEFFDEAGRWTGGRV